jgi:hypothetical protein
MVGVHPDRSSGLPPRHTSDALRVEKELGVIRAVVILWVSGTVTSALLGAFATPIAYGLIGGSGGYVEHRWGLVAAIVVADALIGAVGVTIGVGFFGFRIGYEAAFFALLVGGALTMAFTVFFVQAESHTHTGDPRAIAIPALGLATWPLQLLVGTLLPAFLVNAAARPSAARMAPPEIPPPPPYGGFQE